MTLAERKGGGGILVVERSERQFMAGQEILQGLGIVFRKFRKALPLIGTNNDDRSDTEGQFNVQYPEERLQLPEAFRNMPILLYDDATGQELCTSCFQCERVCPPQVIHITQAKDPATGKPVPAASSFFIEYDTCMSCGYCAEVCPFDAIKMDHDYELSTANHPELDVSYDRLLRPVSYYATIAPTMWAEVKEQAMKKLQNNIKRRPGNIGRDHGQKVKGGAPVAATGTAPAAGAAKAAAKPRGPVAAIGKNMPEEKVARLLAIREANKAKRGGGAVAEAPVETTVLTPEETSAPAPTPAAGTGKASGPVAAIGSNMSDEKRARLEAIRAAKRAQQGE